MEAAPPIVEYSHHLATGRRPFPVATFVAVLSWTVPAAWIALMRGPLMDSSAAAPYLNFETRRYLWLFGAPALFGLVGLLLLTAAFASRRRARSAWWCITGAAVWSSTSLGLVLLGRAIWSGFRLD